ncbi:hypothetical protein ACO0QE_002260 [Hanseniaspora vineae]
MNKNQITRTLDGAVYTLNPISTLSPTTTTLIGSITNHTQLHSLTSSATLTISSPSAFPTNWSTNTATTFSLDSAPSKNTSLIVGLSVGLSIGLFLFLFLAYFALYKSPNLKYCIQRCVWKQKNPDCTLQHDDPFRNIKQNPIIDEKKLYFYGNPHAHRDNLTMSYKVMKVSPDSVHVKTPSQIYASKRHEKHNSDFEKIPLRRQDLSDSQTQLVDRYLYCQPPQLCHISSRLPSKNSSLESVANVGNAKKWNYSSPLSKWFLRSSTYLAESSRASPQYGSENPNTFATEDERSPILNKSKMPKQYHANNGTFNRISKKLSVIKDDQPQTKFELQKINGNAFSEIKRKKQLMMQKNLKMKQTFTTLSKHLDEVALCKPLPLEPSKNPIMPKRNEQRLENFRTSTYEETLAMYEVTREYKPRLLDELYIIPGEYVTVLATHTDGWCLVERANYFEKMTSNIDGEDYLNSNRGIVPMECLKQI